jgi:hypothetical protein
MASLANGAINKIFVGSGIKKLENFIYHNWEVQLEHLALTNRSYLKPYNKIYWKMVNRQILGINLVRPLGFKLGIIGLEVDVEPPEGFRPLGSLCFELAGNDVGFLEYVRYRGIAARM